MSNKNKKKNNNYVTEKRAQEQIKREQAKRAAKNKKILKNALIVLAIVAAVTVLVLGIVLLVGGGKDQPENPNSIYKVTHHATIKVKDYGTIHLELYGEEAPITVNNFVKLANEGFYDGLTFHRIMEGFMAQGGCPKGDGTGDSGTDIKGEFSSNKIDNGIKHVRGTISMARGGYDMDSASSQFFIVHETSYNNTQALDGNYAAFGMVTSGMKTVDKICRKARPTDDNGSIHKLDQPIIESITIHEAH